MVGGLEGAIVPQLEHASPPSEGEKPFCRRFWHLQYPESCILAPSSEESAPCKKIPGATPDFGGNMCLLAIKFPICMRRVIGVMRKIATITFLDTSCLMLIFYCFLFGQKSKYSMGGQGRAKFFD